jgi:hypothetical protein
MYCTNCGVQGNGNFCAACGTRHAGAADGTALEVTRAGEWQDEVRYSVLIRCAAVRDRIAKNSALAGKSMTGEEWLALCDKAFNPLYGVSLKTVATIAAPIYAKMGVKTGKVRTDVLTQPPGRGIVGVLCAFARNGLPLGEVHQCERGCVLEAKLPSDLWALMDGQLVVTVERVGVVTMVDAATTIPGQLYDWGKSTRCLDRLFSNLRSQAA